VHFKSSRPCRHYGETARPGRATNFFSHDHWHVLNKTRCFAQIPADYQISSLVTQLQCVCQRRFAKHHELWNNVGLGYMRLRQLWSWNWCNVIRRIIWSSRLVELRQCAVNVMWGSGPVLFTYWMRGWWNVRFVQCEVRGWRNISGRLCEAEVAWSLCICQVCTLRGRGSVRFAYSSLIWGSASVRLVWCEVQVLWHEVHEMV
jgi:hypothetical protein